MYSNGQLNDHSQSYGSIFDLFDEDYRVVTGTKDFNENQTFFVRLVLKVQNNNYNRDV